MEQNSTTQIFIKSLYEKISLVELTKIANSTKQEILDQQVIYQSYLRLNSKSYQPSDMIINSILSFSKEQ